MPNLNWESTSVLVTGGSGSFGTEMARLLLSQGVGRLRILSRGEERQRLMQEQFADYCKPGGPLSFFIGDVRDLERLKLAFYGVDYIFHAAALKQIPTAEHNPSEAIHTNVQGSLNVVMAALAGGVKRVLFISSDKAVNPLNLYGATKMCGERLFTAANAYAAKRDARFASVRYGNVAGSTGSVYQVFKQQVAEGKPLTVTDPAMTRFWWSIGQATEFAAKAMLDMEPGCLYVPKIPSVRIADLAEAMRGKLPVEVVGLRWGEKMHEVLMTAQEAQSAVPQSGRWCLRPRETRVYGPAVEYSSRDNDWWLTGEEALKLAKETAER